MNEKIILLSLAFVFAIAAVASLYALPVNEYKYEGTLSFETEKAYSEFKQFLVDNPTIDLRGRDDAPRIIVLSSKPPIIVDYVLDVPAGISFPYEYDDKGWGSHSANTQIAFIGATISMIFFFAFMIKHYFCLK